MGKQNTGVNYNKIGKIEVYLPIHPKPSEEWKGITTHSNSEREQYLTATEYSGAGKPNEFNIVFKNDLGEVPIFYIELEGTVYGGPAQLNPITTKDAKRIFKTINETLSKCDKDYLIEGCYKVQLGHDTCVMDPITCNNFRKDLLQAWQQNLSGGSKNSYTRYQVFNNVQVNTHWDPKAPAVDLPLW